MENENLLVNTQLTLSKWEAYELMEDLTYLTLYIDELVTGKRKGDDFTIGMMKMYAVMAWSVVAAVINENGRRNRDSII